MEQVQAFIEKEEAMDHDLDETDILNKFVEILSERLLDLWVKEKTEHPQQRRRLRQTQSTSACRRWYVTKFIPEA